MEINSELINSLYKLDRSDIYPFHMPGHKRRLFPDRLKDAYKLDITEIDGFDNLHEAAGILLEAQNRCARVFGSDRAYFLVNGATCGILAGICGTVREGDEIVVARNCHKSVYNAVMLSGATAHYVYPPSESYFEITGGITASQIREVLESESANPRLVVITSPTYEGVVSDIQRIAEVCHDNNALLMVDAAHGAHFGFSEGFPESAIRLGADIVVTSVHKTLPAPTQTALLLLSDSCPCRERISRMLSVFMSSSPSYILMAGIDSCVNLLDVYSDNLFREYESRLSDFYEGIDVLTNISILTKDKLTEEGSFDFDRSKLVISDKSARLSGKELYNLLLQNYNIQPEMASGSYVLLMTSIADDDKGFARLTKALKEIDAQLDSGSEIPQERGFFGKLFDRIIGRRVSKKLMFASAVFGDYQFIKDEPVKTRELSSIKDSIWSQNTKWEPIELCEGQIAADYIVPYPPCVPVIIPGEELSGEIIDRILKLLSCGITVNGVNENREIQILWEKSST